MPHASRRSSSYRRSARLPKELRCVNLNAAGIDIGATRHHVAVPEDRDPDGQDVREFGTCTADLHTLAAWLMTCGIDTVALESTGVYWIPLFELLSQRGVDVKLVDPRQLKHVPGRKTDVLDCQWLQRLHTFGLLAAAFRPDDAICVLRGYLRQRAMLVSYAADHIQHMQKALEQMNVKLPEVVTDITGVTGMAIIRAIGNGERHPARLAALRDGRCKQSEATIARALEGTWRDEHLFALRQAVELFDVYHAKITDCDRQIQACLEAFEDKSDGTPLQTAPRTSKRPRNTPAFDVRGHLRRLTGVDLTQVDGIDPRGAESHRGNWSRHEALADREALCLVARPLTRQQDLGRQGAEQPHQSIGQPRGGRAADGRKQPASQPFGARRVLPAAEGPSRRAQSDHRDRPETGVSHLQHAQTRHGVRRSRPGILRTPVRRRVLANLTRRAQELGYHLVKTPESPRRVGVASI